MRNRIKRSLPAGNFLFCHNAMGNMMINAIKNLKNKSACVEIPEAYANFAKTPMAPKDAADMRIKPMPIS